MAVYDAQSRALVVWSSGLYATLGRPHRGKRALAADDSHDPSGLGSKLFRHHQPIQKLLSFEEEAFPRSVPSALPKVVIGLTLLLGWIQFGFTWMRSPGIFLLTEPLLFLVWRELLHRFDAFTSANFAQWVFSVAGVQIMIRIAAVLGLLVAPGVGVIG